MRRSTDQLIAGMFDRETGRDDSVAFVWRLVEPDFDALIDAFYAHPGVKAIFAAVGATANDVLRARHAGHWRMVLSRRTDAGHRERCVAVARAHRRIGLSASLYVAAYHVMWRLIGDHLRGLGLPAERLGYIDRVLQTAMMEDITHTIAAFEALEVD